MDADFFGKLSAFVALIAFIPYIYGILKGTTKPNRASWFIWAALGGTILASYHSSGATSTIWIAVIYTIMPLLIFLMALKYGVGGFARLDVFCLLGAIAGLILWKLTNDPEIALYLNIFIDSLGFIPTYKKAYLQPQTESKVGWTIGAAATLINLGAINSWELNIAIYPIYLAVFNTVVVLLLYGIIQRAVAKIS